VKSNTGLLWQEQHSIIRRLKFKEETSQTVHLTLPFYGAENWTLRTVDQKYLGRFEMCWRRMQKIIWTDRVKNEEVLHRVKEERNSLHTIKRKNDNWIGYMLRRNCLLKPVTAGKIKEGKK